MFGRALLAAVILATGVAMGACATGPYVDPEEPAAPVEEATDSAPEEATDSPPAETATTDPGGGAAVADEPTVAAPAGAGAAGEPLRVTFQSEDGTPLVGTAYLTSGPAPGVLLMHQNRADKEAWEPLIQALRADPRTAGFAIFAIDFPGHGESGGSLTDESTLAAARSALAAFRTFNGVDPNRIAMVGASIGADAAVDTCGAGCVAAASVSPGSFLGIAYSDALAALLAEKDPPVLCIAASADGASPAICQGGQTVGLSDYQVQIYDGDAHGNFLFLAEGLTPPPPIADLVVGWLADHLGE